MEHDSGDAYDVGHNTMAVSDSFSPSLHYLLHYTTRLHQFSLYSVGVTIPSCQADQTANMMDMGATRGNHDDSGSVRATRNWIWVGQRFGNNHVEGILAKCIKYCFKAQK